MTVKDFEPWTRACWLAALLWLAGTLAGPLAGALGLASGAQAATVATGWRVGDHGTQTRFVLDLAGPVAFKVVSESNPARLRIELAEVDWKFGRDSGGARPDGLVRAAEFSDPPAAPHIVLWLKGPAQVVKAFLVPPAEGYRYRLVVDLQPGSPGAAPQPPIAVAAPPIAAPPAAAPAAAPPPAPAAAAPPPRPPPAPAPAAAPPPRVASVPPPPPPPPSPARAEPPRPAPPPPPPIAAPAPIAPGPVTGTPVISTPSAPLAQTAAVPAVGSPLTLKPSIAPMAPAPLREPPPAPVPPPPIASRAALAAAAPPEPRQEAPVPARAPQPRITSSPLAPPEPPPEAAAPPPPPAAAAPLPPPRVIREPGRPVVVILALPPMPPPKPADPRPLVMLDAGHGGSDPGAVGLSGVHEKTVTLAMALELKRQLEVSGRYRVELTRSDDRLLPLRERVRLARAARADLFLSIHADALNNRGISGVSVYTESETASDREAEALAAKENKSDLLSGFDFSEAPPAITNILIDLAQRETRTRSAQLAAELVRTLGEVAPLLPRTHRFAGFAVLSAPDVPSVLLELGYLSNRADERGLTSPEQRARLASGILRGIDKFFANGPLLRRS